jgi:hypothetical protein
MNGIVNPEDVLGEIFEVKAVVDAVTYQPSCIVTAKITMELMQDLNACFDWDKDKLVDFFGRALMAALKEKF